MNNAKFHGSLRCLTWLKMDCRKFEPCCAVLLLYLLPEVCTVIVNVLCDGACIFAYSSIAVHDN